MFSLEATKLGRTEEQGYGCMYNIYNSYMEDEEQSPLKGLHWFDPGV